MPPQKRIEAAIARMMNDGFDGCFKPAEVTARLAELSRSIGASEEFEHVPVEPFHRTLHGRCFDNCVAVVKVLGGEVVHGWAWHQLLDLLVVAEFHGVWRAPDGQLIDITPPLLPRASTVFSFDPVRVAPDVPKDAGPMAALAVGVPNQRFALRDIVDVHEWVAAEENNAEFNRRRFGGEQVRPDEAAMVFERNANARARIMDRVRRRQQRQTG